MSEQSPDALGATTPHEMAASGGGREAAAIEIEIRDRWDKLAGATGVFRPLNPKPAGTQADAGARPLARALDVRSARAVAAWVEGLVRNASDGDEVPAPCGAPCESRCGLGSGFSSRERRGAVPGPCGAPSPSGASLGDAGGAGAAGADEIKAAADDALGSGASDQALSVHEIKAMAEWADRLLLSWQDRRWESMVAGAAGAGAGADGGEGNELDHMPGLACVRSVARLCAQVS